MDQIKRMQHINELKSNGIDGRLEEKENNSVNLSLINTPIISESEEPVHTIAFTKVKHQEMGI